MAVCMHMIGSVQGNLSFMWDDVRGPVRDVWLILLLYRITPGVHGRMVAKNVFCIFEGRPQWLQRNSMPCMAYLAKYAWRACKLYASMEFAWTMLASWTWRIKDCVYAGCRQIGYDECPPADLMIVCIHIRSSARTFVAKPVPPQLCQEQAIIAATTE